MRVEFVGLPAAGKTWACRAAHGVLRDLGVPARLDCIEDWRPQRLRLLADYAKVTVRRENRLTVVGSSTWYLRAFGAQRKASARSAWGAVAYLVAVDTHVRALPPAALWLHDQGSVQALWSLAMRSGADVRDLAEGCGGRVSWPDLVVEVQTSTAVIADRLRQRRVTPSSLRTGGRPLADVLAEGRAVTAALRAAVSERPVGWWVLPDDADAGRDVAERVQRALA